MAARDATQIRQLAKAAIRSLDYNTDRDREIVADNLAEIADIAERMDARTGTSDPSWWQRIKEKIG